MGMNPTEPDPINPSNGAARRGKNLARGRGTSRAERWFRSLVQNSSDIIAIYEADGTVRYVSPAVERVLGYRPEELVGTSPFNHVHPEDVELASRSFAEALENSEVMPPLEFRVRAANGSWQHMEVILNNLLDDLNVGGIVANSRDITERKQAEGALREAEERYRAVIEQTIEGIYLGAADSKRVLESNAAFQEMLGYTAGELRGMHIYEFVAHDHENIDSVFQSILDRGHSFIGEWKYRRRDGSVVDVETSATVISYDNREVLCTVVRDVTERKEAEEALKESEERYRAVMEQSVEPIYLYDAETKRLLESNAAFRRMMGFSEEELLGMRIYDFIAHDDEDIDRHVRRSLKEKRRHIGERRYRRKDGSVILVDTSASVIPYGGRTALCAVSRDVTESKQAEEAVRRSKASLDESQRIAHLGTWEWDVVTGEVMWSEETFRIYGFEPNAFDPTFQKLVEVVHPNDRSVLRAAIDEAFARIRPYDFEHRIVRPDGEVRWVHRQGEVVHGEDGEPLQMIGTVHDITERKALEERLEHQAFHDLLTDLPNRRLFVDRLGQALRRTRRRGKRRVAVLFMDIDDFKAINDSLGHEMGNLLLVVVAERLRRCLRPEDTLARFGGDEFVVLIEDVESPEDAVRVAERIVEGLREPFLAEGRELFLRASIGVALGNARQKSTEDLLRNADTAMYEAKEQGSDYRMFDPAMYERAVERLELENELRRAIEADEFVVHYQPIMSLKTGEMWGVEALVRWNHPERGLLDPREFIAVADQSGIVVPMGEGVLEDACRQAKEWQEEHPRIPPLVMSVNISARQLQRPDIAQVVERVLKKTGLESRYLRLDITETLYIKALEGNTQALDELRSLGVSISIDDFGTGYSSLAYLKRLPASALKIDKSFVKGLGEDLEDTAIVGMVRELAHTLGMEVIAEGVESEAQATLLKEMGCDMAQGFHFWSPLPPEAATRFLAKERTS
jgi:diguanylate cyclase (GGDEF)-like protein/PAS domain S-box-containing protein